MLSPVVSTVIALLAMSSCANAFSTGAKSAFMGTPTKTLSPKSATTLRMDSESFAEARLLLEKQLFGTATVSEAEAQHGMPWKTSICPKANVEDGLLYMPFWEWQMSFMQENLTNLKVESCTNLQGNMDFSYQANDKKKARIVNLCLSSNEYRKIRLTYYDAGDNTQVFNSVFYPDPSHDLPVLGIDLLAFNRKKYLAIVDFQPLHDKQPATFEHLLKPIKDQYESLKGRMSSKFYDETQFFSQQMLFARFEKESIVNEDLFPAFKSYVQTHLDLIRDAEQKPKDDTHLPVKQILKYQQDYDSYSAERDPATGLFAAMFGNDWALDFVHDFLFSMSNNKPADGKLNIPAPMGGPPQKAQQQQHSEQKSHVQQPKLNPSFVRT